MDEVRKGIIGRRAAIAANIAQGFSNDLNKGGEGSRGGHVIGHTKSGKAVYAHKDSNEYKDFTPEDHSDAYHLHSKEANSISGKKSMARLNHNIRGKQHLSDSKNYSEDRKSKMKLIKRLSEHSDFFDKVAQHIGEPTDDGESEWQLHQRIADHENFPKFVDSFGMKKGGPGSGPKKGSLVGYTRKHKAVWENLRAEHYDNFDKDDHLDAAKMLKERNLHAAAASHRLKVGMEAYQRHKQ